MSTKRTISLLSVMLMLALAAGMVLAQGSQSLAALSGADGASPQASVGNGFTYQGRLNDGSGNPVTDVCAFDFTLWDAENGGSLTGHQIVFDVEVDSGYLAVLLNSGGEFGADAFTGEARWLKIAVKCSGDADWNILPGRQLLSAAPYALSLRPGTTISGTVTGRSILTVINGDGGGSGLVGYSSDATGVHGQSTNGMGVAGISINQVAVYGESANNTAGFFTSTHGFGVGGNTTSDDPQVAAVEGQNQGAGPGVVGFSIAEAGVYGQSTDGHGVAGFSVNEVAVYGQSENTAGYFTSTQSIGVHGNTTSDDPEVAAVEGVNLGAGPGVTGYSNDGPGGYFANQAGGTVLYAAGDVAQDATAAGLVKAAAFSACTNLGLSFYRAFNTVAHVTGMSGTGEIGECRLDFYFDLSQRYWIAMAYNDTSAATVSCTLDPGDNEVLLCKRWDSAGNPTNGDIMVLVY